MPVRQPIEPCTTDLPIIGAALWWRDGNRVMHVRAVTADQAAMYSRSKIALLDFRPWLDPIELRARQMIDQAK